MIARIARRRLALSTRSSAATRRASHWRRWAESQVARSVRRAGASGTRLTLLAATGRREPAWLVSRFDTTRFLAPRLFFRLLSAANTRHAHHTYASHLTFLRTLAGTSSGAWQKYGSSNVVGASPPSSATIYLDVRAGRVVLTPRLAAAGARAVATAAAPSMGALGTRWSTLAVHVLRRLVEPTSHLGQRASRYVGVSAGLTLPVLASALRSNAARAERVTSELTVLEECMSKARTASAPPALDAAPLNLERLAEQVIERIDRRVVAQRERMGRS